MQQKCNTNGELVRVAILFLIPCICHQHPANISFCNRCKRCNYCFIQVIVSSNRRILLKRVLKHTFKENPYILFNSRIYSFHKIDVQYVIWLTLPCETITFFRFNCNSMKWGIGIIFINLSEFVWSFNFKKTILNLAYLMPSCQQKIFYIL